MPSPTGPTFEYGYDAPVLYDAPIFYDAFPAANPNGTGIADFGIVAEYRYFTTDLLTNEILAEIPFKSVSYERAIKSAGAFEGTINVLPATAHLDLYTSTLPGKCGLYVVRDGVCVWGGIIWSRKYDVLSKSLSISGAEFTSYFHHRFIWKTFSHSYQADFTVSGGTLTGVLTYLTYQFPVTSTIRLIFATTEMFNYEGYYTVASAPDEVTFTVTGTSIPDGFYPACTVYARVDTYDYVRQLVADVMSDFDGVEFASLDLRPSKLNQATITSVSVASDIATFTTSIPHTAITAQSVDIWNMDNTDVLLNGTYDVLSVPSTTSFTCNIVAANRSLVSTPAIVKTVTQKEIIEFVGFLTTSTPHGFTVGETVLVAGVDSVQHPVATKRVETGVVFIETSEPHGGNVADEIRLTGVDISLNGVHYIDTVESPTTLTFTIIGAADMPLTTVTGGTANISGPVSVFDGIMTVIAVKSSTTFCIDVGDTDMPLVNTLSTATVSLTPTVAVGTYGPFPNKANLDIQFSTDAYSGKNVLTTDHRGFELVNVGDELDRYSDTLIGFEYRIDCDIAIIGGVNTFTRTFVLMSLTFPDPPALGQASPPSRFGADKLVFEYPSNIINIEMDESAENAATRFFVTGQIPEMGADAAQPYAAATALDLFADGWPILEAEEARNEIYNVDLLYYHAGRYLSEATPPISTFTVSVNGAIEPKIDSYKPGDWCSIIANDLFVNMRLASSLEIRNNVIVRKIDSYRVTVPDAPSFPETVELVLIRETLADNLGV